MEKTAGLLFFLSGALMWMGIITAEALYPPGYSTALNMISTLGSTPPPEGIVHQPSATIFDFSMMVAGLMIFIGAILSNRVFSSKVSFWPLLSLGIGIMGVGIFPAFHKYLHPLMALTTFVSGGIAAITTSIMMPSPFKYIAIIFGLITLSFLILGVIPESPIVRLLGPGGAERWVGYPVTIWLIGFGGVLMGTGILKKAKSA